MNSLIKHIGAITVASAFGCFFVTGCGQGSGGTKSSQTTTEGTAIDSKAAEKLFEEPPAAGADASTK